MGVYMKKGKNCWKTFLVVKKKKEIWGEKERKRDNTIDRKKGEEKAKCLGLERINNKKREIKQTYN